MFHDPSLVFHAIQFTFLTHAIPACVPPHPPDMHSSCTRLPCITPFPRPPDMQSIHARVHDSSFRLPFLVACAGGAMTTLPPLRRRDSDRHHEPAINDRTGLQRVLGRGEPEIPPRPPPGDLGLPLPPAIPVVPPVPPGTSEPPAQPDSPPSPAMRPRTSEAPASPKPLSSPAVHPGTSEPPGPPAPPADSTVPSETPEPLAQPGVPSTAASAAAELPPYPGTVPPGALRRPVQEALEAGTADPLRAEAFCSSLHSVNVETLMDAMA